MASTRVWTVINISLLLIALLLLLNSVGVELPTLGQALYVLDKEEHLCAVENKEGLVPWNDLDRCCLEARELSFCQQQHKENYDWLCGSVIRLNDKAYYYCRQQPYW